MSFLEIEQLSFSYGGGPGRPILNDISLSIAAGEKVGLVGESGSGKTSLARAILRQLPAAQGSVRFRGQELLGSSAAGSRPLKRSIQYVFQDPLAALDPRWSVLAQVIEPLAIHRIGTRHERRQRAQQMLRSVGLNDLHHGKRPSQLSGGQRQRVVLSRALVLQPELLICDEPIASLDVSVQAQVIDLLERLHRDNGLSFLLISHDLSAVYHFCDRIAVMYRGEIVEIAETEQLFRHPAHPYTKMLLDAMPLLDAPGHMTGPAPVPLPAAMAGLYRSSSAGCVFAPRCGKRAPLCAAEAPLPRARRNGARVSCHFAETGGPR